MSIFERLRRKSKPSTHAHVERRHPLPMGWNKRSWLSKVGYRIRARYKENRERRLNPGPFEWVNFSDDILNMVLTLTVLYTLYKNVDRYPKPTSEPQANSRSYDETFKKQVESPRVTSEELLIAVHKFAGPDKPGILSRIPTSKESCTVSDLLVRNPENKESLSKLWNYILRRKNDLPEKLSDSLKKITAELSVIKVVDENTIKAELESEAKKGTSCGFKFNLGYSFVKADKISRIQESTLDFIEGLKDLILKDMSSFDEALKKEGQDASIRLLQLISIVSSSKP